MKKTLALFLLLSSSLLAAAQETPRWIRKSAISPDGSSIAFCYKGDIFIVDTAGGRALQVTTNAAYDSDPVWSADGSRLFFSSYREGGKDIFVTSPQGGAARRVTDYPGAETPKAVLPDGRVVFTANLQADVKWGGFPSGTQVYAVSPEGGRPELLTSVTMSEISIRGDGAFLYEDYKGYEDPFRKHHNSAVTRDIWLCKDGAYTKLTAFGGEDRQPVFGPDGDSFYYISEQDGATLNLFRGSISSPGKGERLTSYDKNPVRYISVAGNGSVLYSYNGELYLIEAGRGEGRKVDISVWCDENEREMVKLALSDGASSMAVSPDGKEVAVVIRGEEVGVGCQLRSGEAFAIGLEALGSERGLA